MHYYAQHPGLAVTGIDPNDAFREYSTKNAEKHGLSAGRYTWIQASQLASRHLASMGMPADYQVLKTW